MRSSSRLILNTLAQYIRTAVNVICSLIATRLVLSALGDNDFGVYNLIAGIVSMLSFFTNALTSTTQRYLSYNFKTDAFSLLREYFANSLFIHLMLGAIMVLILAACEPLLFDGFLNINNETLGAAKLVYFTVILMLFIALMTSPFRAVLLTHENIVFLSAVDIVDGILKLLIGFALFAFESNRLVWYAVLMTCISLFNILSISIFTSVKFDECRDLSIKLISRTKIRELTSFAGWTIYGTLCLFGRVQGLAIVLNKFFSTIANTAYGIGLQVNSALGSVSGSLQTALAPQLIKAEGNDNRALMLRLSEFGCKISFILLSFVSFPIIFNISWILRQWLGEVPEYTAYFCVILIVSNLCDQLTVGFNSTINAVGNIRNFIVTVNTLKFATTFIVAGLISLGIPLIYAFSAYLAIEIIGCVFRVYFCKKRVGLNVVSYTRNVLLAVLFPTIIICVFYYLSSQVGLNLLGVILKTLIGCLVYGLLIYWWGLDKYEKGILATLVNRMKFKHGK